MGKQAAEGVWAGVGRAAEGERVRRLQARDQEISGSPRSSSPALQFGLACLLEHPPTCTHDDGIVAAVGQSARLVGAIQRLGLPAGLQRGRGGISGYLNQLPSVQQRSSSAGGSRSVQCAWRVCCSWQCAAWKRGKCACGLVPTPCRPGAAAATDRAAGLPNQGCRAAPGCRALNSMLQSALHVCHQAYSPGQASGVAGRWASVQGNAGRQRAASGKWAFWQAARAGRQLRQPAQHTSAPA